jgi:hypothetical protein
MVYSFACSENEDPLVYRFTEQMKRGLKFSSSIWKVYWQGELHIKYMTLELALSVIASFESMTIIL